MSLAAHQIQKSFHNHQVLKQVSLFCEQGEIVGLLGVNGAGKSTLFKIIMGLVSADAGEVSIATKNGKMLGGIIEKPALYEYLNAAENLRAFGKIQGAPVSDAAITSYLDRVGLDTERSDRVKNYSMGMRQRLAIAIALLNDPPFLVLDEPFSGLDPMGVTRLRTLIMELAKERGIGILVSSHLVDEMIRTCDRIYVINDGKIIREDTPRALVENSTSYYVISGEHLEGSPVLKKNKALIQGHIARVKEPPNGIENIIKELAEEGTKIFSCVPETDIKKLLDIIDE